MSRLTERARGISHFLFDKTPAGLRVLPPVRKKDNLWRQGGQTRVAKVKATANLKEEIINSISQLGPLAGVIARGDNVLVKPNYNSPDPPPASTDITFLRAVLEILHEAGANVSVGDCSGAIWRPTRGVFQKSGLYALGKELGVPIYAFEDKEHEWVRVEINGHYVKSVTVPKLAYEADKIVYLPCLKTHSLANFSGALKLTFGLVHPGERRGFHSVHLQEKLAEVNLWRQPDLVIMDGRKAFVAGGPDRGRLVEPGVILASDNMVALDIAAIGILVEHGASSLPADANSLTQIAVAESCELGLKYR